MLCGKIECIGVFAMAWLAMCLHGDAPGHTHCHPCLPQLATMIQLIHSDMRHVLSVSTQYLFTYSGPTSFFFMTITDMMNYVKNLYYLSSSFTYEEILKSLREDNRMYLHCNKEARNFLSTI